MLCIQIPILFLSPFYKITFLSTFLVFFIIPQIPSSCQINLHRLILILQSILVKKSFGRAGKLWSFKGVSHLKGVRNFLTSFLGLTLDFNVEAKQCMLRIPIPFLSVTISVKLSFSYLSFFSHNSQLSTHHFFIIHGQ